VGSFWEMDETLWHKCPLPIWPIKRAADGAYFFFATMVKFAGVA
jgi:hypothetical protein